MTNIHSFNQFTMKKIAPKFLFHHQSFTSPHFNNPSHFLSLRTAMKTTIDAIGAVLEQNLIQGETNADGSTIISEGFFL